ncbi:MAG: phosphohistidine phosphatase SixA [Desulfobacterales bacterium]
MALYLVQHGQSLSKETDPDPGLTEAGAAEVSRIAETAKGYAVGVSAILHSGKRRARETAEIFARHLSPPEGVHEKRGLKPMDDVTAMGGLAASRPGLMLVGHLPFMERLTGWLTAGNPDLTVFRFQNGGIVCLERRPESDLWSIVWSLSPRIK